MILRHLILAVIGGFAGLLAGWALGLSAWIAFASYSLGGSVTLLASVVAAGMTDNRRDNLQQATLRR
jgi:hypothetical protein